MDTTEAEHRDRCAIVGIGTTDYSKGSGRSDLTLATQAALDAIDDAGLSVSDIDGIVGCDSNLVKHNDLADSLGIDDLTYWCQVGPGGVAPCGMVGQAIGAIMSGQAECVLLFRALNGRSGQRRFGGGPSSEDAAVGGWGSYNEFFLPYGLMTPAQMFALMGRRYMTEYGFKEEELAEQLGRIAIACRNRANANPAAQMFGRPLRMEDYLAGRLISRPLRVFDCCLETDGANAVIVTSAERAADCRQPPVLIRAVAQAGGPGVQPGVMFPALLRDSITSLPGRSVAELVYKRAGLGPSDIDVAQFYDCFTVTVLLELEDYGFAPRGEAASLINSGDLELGGKLPINTSGGHLSEAYIHGMNHVVEGVRQIRGESTSQVEGAEVCLVTSAPPPANSALILRAA